MLRFLQKQGYFKNIFNELNEEDENWILDYLSNGRGVSIYSKKRSFFKKIIFTAALKIK